MSSVAHYKQNWWLYLIEGILLVAFGFTAAIVPGQTFLWLGLSFGLLLVGLGIIALINGLRGAGKIDFWWLDIIVGLLELALGFYLLRHPGISIVTFANVAAIALIVRSLLAVFEAFDNSLSAIKRVLIGIIGTIGFLAGIVVWNYPIHGAITMVWVLGLYALVAGPIKMVLAFEAKDAK